MESDNAAVKRLLADVLEETRSALVPLVARRLESEYGTGWRARVLATYQSRHTYQGDASAGDLTGDPGVLFSVILQEWSVLRRALPGCRHWIDLLKGFRNVWAHASGLDLPVAAAAYVVACELGERAGLRNLSRLRASRDNVLAASRAFPSRPHSIRPRPATQSLARQQRGRNRARAGVSTPTAA
jgi:Swt1-like HEPN